MFLTPPKLRPQPCPSLLGVLGRVCWCVCPVVRSSGTTAMGTMHLPVWKKGKSLLEGLIYAKEEQENGKKGKLEGSDV